MRKVLLGFSSLAACAALSVNPAAADVLTFDGAICEIGVCVNFADIHQTYGDTVGLDVAYDSDINTAGVQNMQWWSDSYSGLEAVAFSSFTSGGVAEIFLNPLAGYQVTLLGFDIGSFPNVDRLSQVTILGGNGSSIYASGEITIPGSSPSSFGPYGTRTDGFRIQFGPESYNVGIDNIAFTVSQVQGGVPEPSTWAFMIGGFGAAGAMLRRRRVRAA